MTTSTARECFQKGVDLQERGLFDHAIDEYQRALDLDPENLDVMVNLAAAWLQKGLPEKSIQILQAIIEREPTHSVALYNLGKAHLYREEPARALTVFERALELQPDDPDVKKSIAHCLLALERRSEAADLLLSLSNHLAGDLEALMSLGKLLSDLDRLPAALETYRKAVALACDSAPALEGLIRCQMALDMNDKALTSVKRALMMDPKNPVFHLMMVDLLLAGNEPDAAVDHLKRTLANHPLPELRSRLEELLRRLPILRKKSDGAAGGNRLSRFETDVYDILDRLYDGKAGFEVAIPAMQSLLAKDPGDLFVADELANLLFQARQFEEAVRVYSTVYSGAPGEPRHRIDLAKSIAMAGDIPTAREFLQDSMRELPEAADLPFALGELKLLEKDFTGALQTILPALKAFPEHPQGMFLHAYISFRLGDLATADARFQEILRLSPRDEEAAVWYSRLAILQGEPAKALTAWKAFDDGVESLVEILTKVELAMADGRPDSVMDLLKRVGDYRPRFFEDQVLFAKAFFYAGDFPGALREFEIVLKEDPDHPEALAYAAMAYLARSKAAKFWMCWQRAVESDSLFPVLVGMILRRVLNFSQAERIKAETRKILDISAASPADRDRLTRLLSAL